MREELKEIFQDAWIAADFITKAKDIIEARPLIIIAHKAIADLAAEAKALPPEEEFVDDSKPEPEPEPSVEGDDDGAKSEGVRRI